MTAEQSLQALVAAHGPVRVAACSDLHMGDGGPRDDFGRGEQVRLAAECIHLGSETQRSGAWILLLGDVLDGMRYDLWRCAEVHRPELLWLANMAPVGDGFGVVYLVGNHDAGAGPQIIPGVPFRYAREIVADGWRCWHGDDLDPDPGLWRKVGVWGCRALAWIGRRSAAWEDRVQGWIDRLEARGRNGLPDAYRAAAVAVAAREQCRGAVLGHTHVAADGPDYRNAGTWARDGWLLLMADGTWHRWRC